MKLVTFLSDPTLLLLAAIAVGYILGKVKFFGISFDLSAVLIVSVIMGAIISSFAPWEVDTSFQSSMSLFSKTGTALFVSAVGLTGGSSVAEGLRGKNLISFIVGGVMVGVGILFMKLIGSLDANIDRSLLAGILCGALTSTPGLSAVCDVEKISSDLAVLGYGYAYLFGVIGVVMFVQLMSRRDCDKQKDIANRKEEKLKRSCNVLIPIGVSAVLGTAVGSIRLPFSDHSLGTSAGILCMSLAIGALMKKISVGYDAKNITFIRSLGLMMFFVGSGVPAGIRLSSGFDIKALMYGMILTVLPIFSGYIICRFLLKQKSSEVLCILTGGMTSTPAIGVLLGNPKLKPNLTVYSFAYIGALLAITVCIQFVC